MLVRVCLVGYSVALCSFALQRSPVPADVCVAITGAFYFAFITALNTTLQARVHENVRGRVMALWSVAWLGSTPIGGPIVGWIGQTFGARWSLVVGGLAAVLAGLLGYASLAKIDRRALTSPDAVTDVDTVEPVPEPAAAQVSTAFEP